MGKSPLRSFGSQGKQTITISTELHSTGLFYRMRAQALVQMAPEIIKDPNNTTAPSLGDQEVRHCAAVIVAAFLNPSKSYNDLTSLLADSVYPSVHVKWDFDRFAQSERKCRSGKFFAEIQLGRLTQPTTIVDIHGRILVWYLPGLLLPHLVVCPAGYIFQLVDQKSFFLGRVEQCYQDSQECIV